MRRRVRRAPWVRLGARARVGSSGPRNPAQPRVRSARAEGAGMIGALQRFADELRRRGLEVSPAEVIDAARAARAVGPEERKRFRAALAMTLAKDLRSQRLFDEAFAEFFAPPARGGRGAGPGERPGGAGGGGAGGRGAGEGAGRPRRTTDDVEPPAGGRGRGVPAGTGPRAGAPDSGSPARGGPARGAKGPARVGRRRDPPGAGERGSQRRHDGAQGEGELAPRSAAPGPPLPVTGDRRFPRRGAPTSATGTDPVGSASPGSWPRNRNRGKAGSRTRDGATCAAR